MRRLPQGWLIEYVKGIQPISEAPNHFNLWAAIAVVGAALKNNVKMQSGTYTIYPNMYIVLVAPPGVGKGSAIHPAIAYIKENQPNGLGPICNIMSDRITAPRIIEKLAAGNNTIKVVANGSGSSTLTQVPDSTAIIQSTELATLLSSSDWMMTFLCDLWDRGEYDYDTKNRGTNLVKGMCVSLLGACVPAYIRKLNKDTSAAINGGFTARTIFVYASEPSQRLSNPPTLSSTVAGQKLIDDLKHDIAEIAKLNGTFTMTPQAWSLFDQFYHGPSAKHCDDDSEVMQHFKSRSGVHVKKLAMVFSASHRDDLVIDQYDMTNAILFIEQIRKNLDIAFRGVGDSLLANAIGLVSNFLEQKQVATKNEILKAVIKNVTPEDLDRVLGVLVNIGEARISISGGTIYYTSLSQKSQVQAPNIVQQGQP